MSRLYTQMLKIVKVQVVCKATGPNESTKGIKVHREKAQELSTRVPPWLKRSSERWEDTVIHYVFTYLIIIDIL